MAALSSQTLHTLSQRLNALSITGKLPLTGCLAVFADIKAAQAQIEEALLYDVEAAGLQAFQHSLVRFLPHLAAQLTARNGALAAQLDPDAVRSMCHGLTTLAGSRAGVLFDAHQVRQLGPALQQITDMLLNCVSTAGMPDAIGSNGVVLDILNWVSRALKCALVQPDTSISQAFDQALTLFGHWIPASPSPSAKAPSSAPPRSPYLSARQLGKCAVQINTIVRYKLVAFELDSAAGPGNRERIVDCAFKLCSPSVLQRLGRRPIDHVAVISICNLVKDLLDARLLSFSDPRLMPALAGLVRLIGDMKPGALLEGDCRALSNCANFLRMMHEEGVPAQAAFAPFLPTWDQACNTVLCCVASDRFGKAWPSAQAVTNLISFVKCQTKRLPREEESLSATMQATMRGLRGAARRLVEQAIQLDSADIESPATMGGLLSGLEYLLRVNLVARSGDIEALLGDLLETLGSATPPNVSGDTQRALLPALRGLLRMGVFGLDRLQPALACLGLPCGSSSGAISVADLDARIQALRAVEEPDVALPAPEPEAAPTGSAARGASASPAASRTSTPGRTKIDRKPVWNRMVRGRKVQLEEPPEITRAPEIVASAAAPVAQLAHVVPTRDRAPTTTAGLAPTGTSTTSATPPAIMTVPMASGAGQTPAPPSTTIAKSKQAEGKSTNSNAGPRKTGAADYTSKGMSPRQEWFALLKGKAEPVLERLRQLGSDAAVLNARERVGKEERGALFHALQSGKAEVVRWLMAPNTGYRREAEPGPLLDALFRDNLYDKKSHDAAIGHLVDGLDPDARAHFVQYLRKHRPLQVGLNSLLEEKGLLENAPQPQAVPSGRAGRKGNQRKVAARDRAGPDMAQAIRAVEEHKTLVRAEKFASTMRADGTPLLALMSRLGLTTEARKLLSGGRATVHERDRLGRTSLSLAAEYGHLGTVQLLLKYRAKVDDADHEGYTALMFAAAENHADVVEALLEANATVDQETAGGHTALMRAAVKGALDVVKLLLAANANVDLLTKTDRTPLMLAAYFGFTDVVEALLAGNANVNMTTSDGATALHMATSQGHADVVNLLLEWGIEVDKTWDNGTAALLMAADLGHVEIVKALLARHAKLDLATTDGNTALIAAASQGHIEVARLLLEHGADPDIRNNEGESATDIARLSGHDAIVKLLGG